MNDRRLTDGRVLRTLRQAHHLLTATTNTDITVALVQGAWEARSPIRPSTELLADAEAAIKDAARLPDNRSLSAWQSTTDHVQVLAALQEAIRRTRETTAVARVRAFLDARKPLEPTEGDARDIIMSVATNAGPVHLTISDLEVVLDAGQER
uniref:hypothetical protein n=1 Tax=Nonomuraea sp. CA-251285 TaxID=3240002 RepID=UPI003F4970F3